MILTSITSRQAVIKGELMFYIKIELEGGEGFNTRSTITMDINKGANLKELYDKLKSLSSRVLDG